MNSLQRYRPLVLQ